MPVTNTDIPQHLTSGVKVIFREAYDNVDGIQWPSIATEIPSSKDTESYAFLGATPGVREFVGERIVKGLAEYDYTLKNKEWEATLGIKRSTLEDDQYGQIKIRIQDLAQSMRMHQESLVFGLLPLGASSLCYDGQYFFDTDHSEGSSGTQSNKGTSALEASTLQAGITAMSKFKNDRGEPMGVIPDTLVVPPDLKWTAKELLQSTYNVDGTANNAGKINVLQGELILVVSPYLTDADNWYLLCTRRIIKPLIFQNRVPVSLEALEENSTVGFTRSEWQYGSRGRYNAGYGLWQLAYGGIV